MVEIEPDPVLVHSTAERSSNSKRFMKPTRDLMQRLRLIAYFTAPAVMPLMMCFSSSTPMKTSGKMPRADRAAIDHQLMP